MQPSDEATPIHAGAAEFRLPTAAADWPKWFAALSDGAGIDLFTEDVLDQVVGATPGQRIAIVAAAHRLIRDAAELLNLARFGADACKDPVVQMAGKMNLIEDRNAAQHLAEMVGDHARMGAFYGFYGEFDSSVSAVDGGWLDIDRL